MLRTLCKWQYELNFRTEEIKLHLFTFSKKLILFNSLIKLNFISLINYLLTAFHKIFFYRRFFYHMSFLVYVKFLKLHSFQYHDYEFSENYKEYKRQLPE